jgi:hypothetical protein
MSRILRRPMFRGGPVSSYGTGITSGLDKPKRGLVNEPGGYAGEKSGMDFLKNALNKYVLGSKTQIGNTSPFSANVLPQKSSFEEMIFNNQFGNQDPTKVEDVTIEDKIESYTPDNEVIRSILEKQSTYVDDDGVERSTTTGEEIVTPSKTIPQDGFLPTPGPEKGSAPKKTITDNLLSTDSILNRQNTANEELTLEEIRDTLGYKKARSRDMGDMLARASASFLGTGGVREGLAEFMKSEAAAGPGRAEKIETAAATFMLKDKAQSKRDRANVELMKSKIDYQIEAGEDISLPKALLAANKSGMLNNKELSVGIQSATSPTTGKNYNFKKVVNRDEFEIALKTAKPGDTFVVKTKVKDSDTGSEKILKSIVEIDLTGTPQRIYNIA